VQTEASFGFPDNMAAENANLRDEVVLAGFGVGGSLARADLVRGKDVLACSLPWKIQNLELCVDGIVLHEGERRDCVGTC
jgi:hypothetical protein